MGGNFINITEDNIGSEHLCCIIRSKKPHPGVEAKRSCSDQRFAEKFGFTTADTTAGGYRLFALSFDGSTPRFTENAKRERIASQELTIYYSEQCPFIQQYIEGIRQYCGEKGVTAAIECVDTLEKAKALPCVFNNWAAFYKGEFLSVNLFDKSRLDKILK